MHRQGGIAVHHVFLLLPVETPHPGKKKGLRAARKTAKVSEFKIAQSKNNGKKSHWETQPDPLPRDD
jgi:hypothetical protein